MIKFYLRARASGGVSYWVITPIKITQVQICARCPLLALPICQFRTARLQKKTDSRPICIRNTRLQHYTLTACTLPNNLWSHTPLDQIIAADSRSNLFANKTRLIETFLQPFIQKFVLLNCSVLMWGNCVEHLPRSSYNFQLILIYIYIVNANKINWLF